MAEPGRVCPTLPRQLTPLAIFLLLCCAAAVIAPPAKAAKESLPAPSAFRLPASNGYTLNVVGIPPNPHSPARLLVIASAKGRFASYSAPATVTETSIESNLGGLGEVAVTFQRSNRASTVPCGKRSIRYDSGQYVGRIVFHGEEGFTSAEAVTAPGNIDFWLQGACGEGFFGSGPPERARGAELFVKNPALGPQLSARKSRPGAAAFVGAWTREFSNGISIERVVDLRVPGADFTYDRSLRTATVRPPPPFAGSARFDLAKKAGQRWSGDLTVDLPGKAGVPLTAPALRASLSPSE